MNPLAFATGGAVPWVLLQRAWAEAETHEKQTTTHTLLEVMMMGVVPIAEVGDRSEGTTLIDAGLDCP